MLSFPSAKINIGLHVVRRRGDGYHDISTIMIPIPLFDVLEIVVDNELQQAEVIQSRSGIEIPGDPGKDLCALAIEEVGKYRQLPGLRVHLHKAIPIGAGLGGGSSDAAHTLQLLNNILDLRLDHELPAFAGKLGSDCPFFLNAGTQVAEGKGDELRALNGLDLKGKWLMLVHPGIHVPTAEVYKAMRPTGSAIDLDAIVHLPIEEWKDQVVNDMEEVVFKLHPSIALIKEKIMNAGAEYASMSGSGSSVYGIFRKKPRSLRWPTDHKEWILELS